MKKKRAAADEMDRWHHRLNGHKHKQTERHWRTGKRGMVLQSMGSQRVGHDLASEQQQQIKRTIDSLQRIKVQIVLID